MLSYVARRILFIPVVLLGVSLLIFLMLQCLTPYQRVSAYVTSPARLKSVDLDELVEEYGLNKSVPIQYFKWLSNVMHGNLGWSETAGMPVSDAIFHFFPVTFELALYAVIPVVIVGIWLGVITAVHHNDPIDHAARVLAIIGWSFPTFVFALLVLMIFYGVLDWFPSGSLSTWATTIVNSTDFHRYTGMNTLDSLLNRRFNVFLDALRHLVLPVTTLAYVSWALLLRIMRSSMLETLRQDYVTTARAKGLREKVVIKKHAGKNALMPVVTIGGLLAVWLLSGDVVVEYVFDYKGIGQWAANAALQLDIPSVLGFALLSAVLMVVVNLIVDVLYVYIDPRVRLG